MCKSLPKSLGNHYFSKRKKIRRRAINVLSFLTFFSSNGKCLIYLPDIGVPLATVKEALNHFNTCPAQLILVMQKLLRMPAPDVWQFSELLVSQIKEFMRPDVPQLISQLFGKLWFHMNGVFPRKLWTLTVNYMNHVVNGQATSLRTMKKITQVN